MVCLVRPSPNDESIQASIGNDWEQLPVLHLLITAGVTLGDIRLLRVQRVSQQQAVGLRADLLAYLASWQNGKQFLRSTEVTFEDNEY